MKNEERKLVRQFILETWPAGLQAFQVLQEGDYHVIRNSKEFKLWDTETSLRRAFRYAVDKLRLK